MKITRQTASLKKIVPFRSSKLKSVSDWPKSIASDQAFER